MHWAWVIVWVKIKIRIFYFYFFFIGAITKQLSTYKYFIWGF